MRGFEWGFWGYPGSNQVYPANKNNLFFLTYGPWFQGTCATFGALDLRLLEDEDLRENIYLAIFADVRIPKSDKNQLTVSAEKGIITLSGKVKNRLTKILAYTDAFNTPGVTEVINEIEIEKLLPTSYPPVTAT